jgi:hypothetical protein
MTNYFILKYKDLTSKISIKSKIINSQNYHDNDTNFYLKIIEKK